MFGILKSILGTKDDPKLAKALKKGAFLVDVRTTSEFSAGSVKGAVNIPLDQLQEQLMKFKGKRNIVVFCRSGNRSGQAKLLLEKKGYRNVINGGSWQNVKQAIKKLQ